jgi:endonuclease/exonuclease/phosphatase family metal-dependent hydrolase
MNVRVHPYRQVQPGRGRRSVTAWCTAFSAAASLFFAAAPQAAAQTRALPGTIQAEDFDSGGNGYAYRDTTSGNAGGQYRSTDVDIESSSEGGYDVGWAAPGEWLNYTVNVASAGTYTFEARVASQSGGGFYVHFNGVNVTGTMYVGGTGGWQSWTTIRKTVTLAAGTQSMRVTFDSGAVNLNYVTLTSSSGTVASTSSSGSTTSVSTSTGTSSPFGGVALAIPGWVQAEDFDAGGQNVAYYDATSGNSGGAYRSTDVDIQTTGSGGYAVGWIGAGEWLKYTVNVGAAGTYTAVARVASPGTGGTFHIEFNGTNKTGTMQVPNTGSWQTYTDVKAQVSLSAGVQSMRIVFDSNGTTGAVGNLSAVRFDTGSTTTSTPTTTTTTTTTTTSGSSSSGGRLRMMTWNIHFGGGNTYAQAQLIANAGVDVATLEEASTYDENMPVTYRDRLQQLTGNTWYSAWGPSLTSGASQGTLILSRYPIVASTSTVLEGTGTVRAQIDVNGVRIQIFAVHLEYYDTAKRTRQLSLLMNWAQQFSGPRLVGGDFNSWWGESWIQTMETQYSDTWEMVSGSVQNGYTLNGSVRFDYLFRSFTDETRVRPTACWVQSTSLSDHSPVIADYAVQ